MLDINRVYCGDCLDILPQLDLVDSVITDPPYGLSFMGKNWDHGVPGVVFWETILDRMKPGAHLLAFGGTRTHHRLMVAIEDAGFEIRDVVMWVYGSGFPKSLDVSKAIDKVNGETQRAYQFTKWMRTTGLTAKQIDTITDTNMGGHYLTNKSQPAIPTCELFNRLRPHLKEIPEWVDILIERVEADREIVGHRTGALNNAENSQAQSFVKGAVGWKPAFDITESATNAAKQWEGYGTALKPSFEPIVLCRKPLTYVPIGDSLIVDTQNLLGGLLCQLLSNVNNVERISRLSPNASGEVSVSALMIAAVLHGNKLEELYEVMGTSNSQEMVSTCLNIALSWNNILGAIYSSENTFTTSTITSLTTALKTLNYLISEITPESIIKGVSSPLGLQLNAMDVDNGLSGERKNMNVTQIAFATALAGLTVDKSSTTAKNATDYLLPTIHAVDSVLSHALQQLVTENEERIKPNAEPIILARKPLDGTVANNVLTYGVGGLNIDGSRVGTEERFNAAAGNKPGGNSLQMSAVGMPQDAEGRTAQGRWPANFIHDGSDEVVELFPDTKGKVGMTQHGSGTNKVYGTYTRSEQSLIKDGISDSGSAARFFYTAKASKKERGEDNNHPTVKPLALMQYLCNLITPPNGTILDPFAGSGTTGVAAINTNHNYVLIEKEPKYVIITVQRLEAAKCSL